MGMTFDEWFKAKYGATFEELHMQPYSFINETMRVLANEVRAYVSEVVKDVTK